MLCDISDPCLRTLTDMLETINGEKIAIPLQLLQHISGRIKIGISKRRAFRSIAIWGAIRIISTSVGVVLFLVIRIPLVWRLLK